MKHNDSMGNICKVTALPTNPILIFVILQTENQQFDLSPRLRRGGKSGQHRAPYFLTGRVLTTLRFVGKQQVPQKITSCRGFGFLGGVHRPF